MTSAILAAAAFGDDPGRWPLPAAADPRHRWLRAVAAGGQGRYATAAAELTEVLRGRPETALAALALSTRASFLRQLGWHRPAHDWDGRAWAQSGGNPEAGVDALIGLAADALGVGRFPASAALLSRAADMVRNHPELPPRLEIRLAWVRAELAMAGGDGRAATRHARRGFELAQAALPLLGRHRVKSDLVLAAALCCAGDPAGSRAVADAALAAADRDALVPLQWALAGLLTEIGSGVHSPAVLAQIRDRTARFVVRHGGRWNAH